MKDDEGKPEERPKDELADSSSSRKKKKKKKPKTTEFGDSSDRKEKRKSSKKSPPASATEPNELASTSPSAATQLLDPGSTEVSTEIAVSGFASVDHSSLPRLTAEESDKKKRKSKKPQPTTSDDETTVDASETAKKVRKSKKRSSKKNAVVDDAPSDGTEHARTAETTHMANEQEQAARPSGEHGSEHSSPTVTARYEETGVSSDAGLLKVIELGGATTVRREEPMSESAVLLANSLVEEADRAEEMSGLKRESSKSSASRSVIAVATGVAAADADEIHQSGVLSMSQLSTLDSRDGTLVDDQENFQAMNDALLEHTADQLDREILDSLERGEPHMPIAQAELVVIDGVDADDGHIYAPEGVPSPQVVHIDEPTSPLPEPAAGKSGNLVRESLCYGRRRRTCVAIMVTLAIPVVVAIALVFILLPTSTERLDSGDPVESLTTSLPSPAPTRYRSERLKLVEQAIVQHFGSGSPLDDPLSAQATAASWLADADTRVDFPLKTVADTIQFKQRYALTVFAYSTSVFRWSVSTNWLSSVHECEWFGIERCDEDLRVLSVSIAANLLAGTIPVEVSGLTFVDNFVIEDNPGLVGTIPTEFAGIEPLQKLRLRNCALSGTIPEQFNEKFNLAWFYLNGNKLRGTVPSLLGQLPVLEFLYLYENELHGPLPESLLRSSSLTELSLRSNQLTGTIPSLGSYSGDFLRLNLSGNQLRGPIPDDVGSKLNLRDLVLNDNELTGPIPTTIGQLTALEELALESNKLTGTMPQQVCNQSNATGGLLYLITADCFEVDCPCCTSCP